MDAAVPLLEVRHLSRQYPVGRTLLARPRAYLHAVQEVSFTLQAGETLAVVGKSGCGKTTLGRCVLRLDNPSEGEIRFKGEDLAAAAPARRRALPRRMQTVFQDPYGSLNPRKRVR